MYPYYVRDSIPDRGKRFLSSQQSPDRLGSSRGISPVQNRKGREADHLPQSNGDQEWWINISTPPYVLMVWYLIN
jgi:hypothetical protein